MDRCVAASFAKDDVMNSKNNAGDYPAFPVTAGQQVYANGLKVRDWFAGQALTGMDLDAATPDQCAAWAYRIADAMLKAREADQ